VSFCRFEWPEELVSMRRMPMISVSSVLAAEVPASRAIHRDKLAYQLTPLHTATLCKCIQVPSLIAGQSSGDAALSEHLASLCSFRNIVIAE